VLDTALKVQGARVGWTEAAYWRSANVVHAPSTAPNAAGPPRGPTLLIGDACCGRPFWLGSTLNGHFADLEVLVNEGTWHANSWAAEGLNAFGAYIERMRALRRCGEQRPPAEFRRPTAQESALVYHAPGRRGMHDAIAADLLRTAAAAARRLRARAVGVDRAEIVRTQRLSPAVPTRAAAVRAGAGADAAAATSPGTANPAARHVTARVLGGLSIYNLSAKKFSDAAESGCPSAYGGAGCSGSRVRPTKSSPTIQSQHLSIIQLICGSR